MDAMKTVITGDCPNCGVDIPAREMEQPCAGCDAAAPAVPERYMSKKNRAIASGIRTAFMTKDRAPKSWKDSTRSADDGRAANQEAFDATHQNVIWSVAQALELTDPKFNVRLFSELCGV